MHTCTIFFDIGATLITGPALTPARQIAKALRLSNHINIDTQLLTSVIETPEALRELLVSAYAVPLKRATDLSETVWRSQRERIKPVPGGIDILYSLKKGKIRYGFISNIWFPYATTFADIYGRLAKTDLTFFSFRLGLKKPNLDLFKTAVEFAGTNPQTCIMVGDSYKNDMQPAMTLGMKTVWFLCRPEKERVGLEKIRQNILPAPDKIISSLVGLKKIVLSLVG